MKRDPATGISSVVMLAGGFKKPSAWIGTWNRAPKPVAPVRLVRSARLTVSGSTGFG